MLLALTVTVPGRSRCASAADQKRSPSARAGVSGTLHRTGCPCGLGAGRRRPHSSSSTEASMSLIAAGRPAPRDARLDRADVGEPLVVDVQADRRKRSGSSPAFIVSKRAGPKGDRLAVLLPWRIKPAATPSRSNGELGMHVEGLGFRIPGELAHHRRFAEALLAVRRRRRLRTSFAGPCRPAAPLTKAS